MALPVVAAAAGKLGLAKGLGASKAGGLFGGGGGKLLGGSSLLGGGGGGFNNLVKGQMSVEPVAHSFFEQGPRFDVYDVPLVGPAIGGAYQGITEFPGKIQQGLQAFQGSDFGQALGGFADVIGAGLEGARDFGQYGIGGAPPDYEEEIRRLRARIAEMEARGGY